MIDWDKVQTAEDKAHQAKVDAYESAKSGRETAYKSESDPLFFKAQRGESTLEEWKAKVQEIKERFAYPEGYL